MMDNQSYRKVDFTRGLHDVSALEPGPRRAPVPLLDPSMIWCSQIEISSDSFNQCEQGRVLSSPSRIDHSGPADPIDPLERMLDLLSHANLEQVPSAG